MLLPQTTTVQMLRCTHTAAALPESLLAERLMQQVVAEHFMPLYCKRPVSAQLGQHIPERLIAILQLALTRLLHNLAA